MMTRMQFLMQKFIKTVENELEILVQVMAEKHLKMMLFMMMLLKCFFSRLTYPR